MLRCEVQIYYLISVWCQDCNVELRCPHQIKFDTIIQSTNTTRVNIKPSLFSRATTTRATTFITWPISREKLWSCCNLQIWLLVSTARSRKSVKCQALNSGLRDQLNFQVKKFSVSNISVEALRYRSKQWIKNDRKKIRYLWRDNQSDKTSMTEEYIETHKIFTDFRRRRRTDQIKRGIFNKSWLRNYNVMGYKILWNYNSSEKFRINTLTLYQISRCAK